MLWAEGSAGVGECGKSVYFGHKTEKNYNQGDAPKMSEARTRSERFGHLTAADFGRAAGRAAATKRGTEGKGAADFSQWCEKIFAVVGVFSGRGGSFLWSWCEGVIL